VRWEKLLGLYQEQRIQDAFLSARWFVRFLNIYYGSFHFFVTAGALIACYHLRKRTYRLIRNTLAATTALALVGFALFPLMPPRLLDNPGPYGADALHTGDYGYVDTLAKVGGLWSFDSGTMQSISNQYAAMPSLHIGWSVWCAVVLWPLVNRRWWRALLVGYPLLTLFCIVVTANHYWIDGLGGLVTLAAGYSVARLISALWPRISPGTAPGLVTASAASTPGIVQATTPRQRRAGS
jgi:PAP2 superfamily